MPTASVKDSSLPAILATSRMFSLGFASTPLASTSNRPSLGPGTRNTMPSESTSSPRNSTSKAGRNLDFIRLR